MGIVHQIVACFLSLFPRYFVLKMISKWNWIVTRMRITHFSLVRIRFLCCIFAILCSFGCIYVWLCISAWWASAAWCVCLKELLQILIPLSWMHAYLMRYRIFYALLFDSTDVMAVQFFFRIFRTRNALNGKMRKLCYSILCICYVFIAITFP